MSESRRPLHGRTILVTRARDQAGSLASLLAQAGAEVVEFPTIAIRPLDPAPLDAALCRLSEYDWLIFTSANAVDIFFLRMRETGVSTPMPPVCVIGPATAEQVRAWNADVALEPELYQAEGVLAAFAERVGELSGLRLLLPRAQEARELLPQELERRGARVDVIPIYETVPPPGGADRLRSLLDSHPIDLVTLTSSSTARNFAELAGGPERLRNLRFAAIGPITAETARRLGMAVVCTARESTIPGLVQAIVEYFAGLDTAPGT